MIYILSVTVADFKNKRATILGYPGSEVTLVSQKDDDLFVQNKSGVRFHVFSSAVKQIIND